VENQEKKSKTIVYGVVVKDGEYYKKMTPVDEPAIKDISIDDLIGDQLLVLYRETKHLVRRSSEGPLDPPEGVALERVMKLTQVLKEKEQEMLENMSDEQIQEMLAKKA